MTSNYMPYAQINIDNQYHLSYSCSNTSIAEEVNSAFKCTSIKGTKTVKVFTFESRYYNEEGDPVFSQTLNLLMADYNKTWGCRYIVA